MADAEPSVRAAAALEFRLEPPVRFLTSISANGASNSRRAVLDREMPMAQDVVKDILALDSRAEEAMARARQEATEIRYQTASHIDEMKADFDRRTVAEVAHIEADAAAARDAQRAKVAAEFESDASRVRNTPSDRLGSAVARIVAEVKGTPHGH